mmetsp:Transcript_79045/g.228528  ORF Transcript_79045/g.228528 Transcript_79045/m.228528 type:complete len:225 (-) Transcript_79045:309-983(-)
MRPVHPQAAGRRNRPLSHVGPANSPRFAAKSAANASPSSKPAAPQHPKRATLVGGGDKPGWRESLDSRQAWRRLPKRAQAHRSHMSHEGFVGSAEASQDEAMAVKNVGPCWLQPRCFGIPLCGVLRTRRLLRDDSSIIPRVPIHRVEREGSLKQPAGLRQCCGAANTAFQENAVPHLRGDVLRSGPLEGDVCSSGRSEVSGQFLRRSERRPCMRGGRIESRCPA